ncbi:MAG: hypothetical protein KBS96_08795 [Lachnospiraceae bacterium]|nr:hypothetical protein [Candidatus Colinaster scatohippi]
MLDIITNYTTEDCNQLLGEFVTLREITGEVEGVRTALFALAADGLEEVIARLGAEVANLGEESEILKQMAQALDKINLCYQNGENRICDYAESGVIQFAPKELKTVNLSEIAELFGLGK